MRLFVGFSVPAEVQRAVCEQVESLRSRTPEARWVRPENLHVTLVFLGEVSEEQLPALDAVLSPAFAAHPAMVASVGGGGTFPAARPARVAWVGVALDPAGDALQADVSRASAGTLETTTERRPFHPHLTLARCRPPWPRSASEAWNGGIGGRLAPPFSVDRGTLFASRASPEGVRYSALAEYPLQDGSNGGAVGGG